MARLRDPHGCEPGQGDTDQWFLLLLMRTVWKSTPPTHKPPLLSLSLSLSPLSFLSLSLSLSLYCVLRHHCDAAVMVRCDVLSSSLWSPCVSPLILRSSSLFLELSLCSSLSLSFFLSFFLSFSFSVCCLSRHHCDVTVMLRCDMISLPLFWSPCVSHLFLQSTRSLSFSLSLSQSLALFSLSFSFFLSVSLRVARRVTTVIPR